MNKVYQIVTDRIVAQMDKGIIPWKQPWAVSGDEWNSPRNWITKKAYRGINVMLLGSAGYECPHWATYNQLKSIGGMVKKGEKSSPIVFWSKTSYKDKDNDDEERQSFILRYYNAFNLEQVDGIEVPVTVPPEEDDTFTPIEKAERLVERIPNRCPIKSGGSKAFYSPYRDFVMMPDAKAFYSPEEYYSTLFHELAHSTGHTSRLNRFKDNKSDSKGTKGYAREELRAELASCYLMNDLKIKTTVTEENSVAYLQSWRQRLIDDPTIIMATAGKAQEICDYIHGRKRKGEDE